MSTAWRALARAAALGLVACGHPAVDAPRLIAEPAPTEAHDENDLDREACPRARLALPFPAGTTYAVLQGDGDAFTHHGSDAHAIDFDLPPGMPVVAAAAGVVVEVVDTFVEGGPSPALKERANVVVVDLGGGCFAVYQHLAPRSAAVREGERVERGELLARSGNTGWSSRPHLHFEVTDVFNRSMPVGFVELSGRAPRTGEQCRSGNVPPPVVRSMLARETFASNGVLLDEELPARRLNEGHAIVHVRGRVTNGATHAIAVLFERGGEVAVTQALTRVDAKGAFALRLSVAGLAGRWNFAVTTVDAEGRYHSAVSVPVVVTTTSDDTSPGPARR